MAVPSMIGGSKMKYMYNKDGARLFQWGEEIPSDYVDCPTKVGKVVKKAPVKKKAK